MAMHPNAPALFVLNQWPFQYAPMGLIGNLQIQNVDWNSVWYPVAASLSGDYYIIGWWKNTLTRKTHLWW